jgi:uncharacterized protein YukE
MGGGITPPDTAEIIERIKAVDCAALESAARAMDSQAAALETECERLRGVYLATINMWKGAAAASWNDHANACMSNLDQAHWPLTQMAVLLREYRAAAETAKSGVNQVAHYAVKAYEDPTDGADVSAGEKLAKQTADTFHHAEQRIRTELFKLGDLAPGPVPDPVIPPTPQQAWWKNLLFGAPPPYTLPIGPHGQIMSYDEDGNLVAAHWGHAVPMQILEDGIGSGLARLLAKFAGEEGAAAGKVSAEAFAKDIAESNAWRPSHIDPKIREWYNLKPGDDIQPWMRKDFLDTVSGAAAKSSNVFRWDVSGQPGDAVLHYDQATKRWLAVVYYASGPRAGEFMSTFAPDAAKVDEMLRAAATRKVG